MQNPRQNLCRLIYSALVCRERVERNGIWEATLSLFGNMHARSIQPSPLLALAENIIKLLPSRSLLLPTPYRASHSLSLTFLRRRWMSTTSDLSPSLSPASRSIFSPRLEAATAAWCVFTRIGISSLDPCSYLISLGITDKVPRPSSK